MFQKPLLVLAVVLVLSSLACRAVTELPFQRIETGPVETEEIDIPAPDAESADVRLSFSAGSLEIHPGETESLIEGTATYNVADLQPEVTVDGENIRIETGDVEFRGIPNFRDNFRNEWDLRLGDFPMDLSINAGAYDGTLDLGGLSLLSLEINDGASNVELTFSEPNQVEMDELTYQTGASNVEMTGLANANFADMTFRSGAGDYTLDFSGELQQDADVRVESGISQLTIVVPEGTPAEVTFTGNLSNAEAEGPWERNGDVYTLAGEGPGLTITVDMGAGSLRLRTP